MGFFDNLLKNDLLPTGGGIIGSIFSNKASKRNRETMLKVAQMNYDAQMKANETNIHLAREANDLNYKMFQEQNEYNSPLAQRQRMEAAGMNPFLNDAVSAGKAGSPMAAQAAHVDAPQYDMSAYIENEKLRQSNIQNSIGSMSQLLDIAVKAGKLESEVRKGKADAMKAESSAALERVNATIAQLTQDTTVKMRNEEYKQMQLKNAMDALKLDFLPQEQQARLGKVLAETNFLEKQAVYYDEKKHEVVANTDYINKQTKKILKEIDILTLKEIGIKYDNEQKRIIAENIGRYINAQISQLLSQVALNGSTMQLQGKQGNYYDAHSKYLGSQNEGQMIKNWWDSFASNDAQLASVKAYATKNQLPFYIRENSSHAQWIINRNGIIDRRNKISNTVSNYWQNVNGTIGAVGMFMPSLLKNYKSVPPPSMNGYNFGVPRPNYYGNSSY